MKRSYLFFDTAYDQDGVTQRNSPVTTLCATLYLCGSVLK